MERHRLLKDEDFKGEILERLAIIHPFYNDHIRLRVHYDNWSTWTPDTKQRVGVILVDDHSDEPLHEVFDSSKAGGVDVEIYRIKDDMQYATPAALNLGFVQAYKNYDHALCMDSDCLLERDSIEALLSNPLPLGWKNWFNFERKRITKLKGRPSEITNPLGCAIMMHSRFFEAMGGFDEDFIGSRSHKIINSLRAREHLITGDAKELLSHVTEDMEYPGYGFFDNYFISNAMNKFGAAWVPEPRISEYIDAEDAGGNVQDREGLNEVHRRVNKHLKGMKDRGALNQNRNILSFEWERTL